MFYTTTKYYYYYYLRNIEQEPTTHVSDEWIEHRARIIIQAAGFDHHIHFEMGRPR